MTTPAINEDQRDAPWHLLREIYPAVGPEQAHWDQYSRPRISWYWRVRPASGSSPLRADGTRAPRGWDHRWGTLVPLRGYWEWINSTRWKSFDGPAWDAADAILVRLNHGWIGGFDGYTFPHHVVNAARTRMLNKLLTNNPESRDGTSYSFGETLGELRESISFTYTGLEKIFDFLQKSARELDTTMERLVKDLLKGKPLYKLIPPSRRSNKRLIKRAEAIPAAWLAFQFGLMPMVSDVQALNSAIEEGLSVGPLKFTVKSGYEDKTSSSAELLGPQRPSHKVTEIFEVVYRCHLSCTYEVTDVKERRLAQLGLTNSPLVLYQLAPWSWAVDYFLGVSDWLSALLATSGTRFLEGSESTIGTIRSIGTSKPYADPGVNLVVWPSGQSVIDCGRFSRVVLSSTPLPTAPVWKPELGLNRMANLASAIAQSLR